MRAGDRIKIGYAATGSAVARRFTAIQASSPVPVDLLAAVEGTREDERAWHTRWRALRQHSEWFESTPELLRAIGEVEAVDVPQSDTARLSFRCPPSLVTAVDNVRGSTPRERYLRDLVRRAVEQALRAEPDGAPPAVERAQGARLPARPPAPAEQPTEPKAQRPPFSRVRTSAEVRANVRPIPKP